MSPYVLHFTFIISYKIERHKIYERYHVLLQKYKKKEKKEKRKKAKAFDADAEFVHISFRDYGLNLLIAA
jgi:hypothetical protein